LQACAPNVAAQFARVALAADFVYCYNVLDSNKRSEVQDKSSSPSRPAIHIPEDDIGYEMTTFFPFDPYKLPKSQTFIHGLYRTWESVAIDDEEDDEEDDEIRDPDLDGKLSVPLPRRPEDQGLNASLGAMSISPVRHIGQTQAQPMSVS
jgi:RNA polymerase I-specific transcription initiation factor RRN3